MNKLIIFTVVALAILLAVGEGRSVRRGERRRSRVAAASGESGALGFDDEPVRRRGGRRSSRVRNLGGNDDDNAFGRSQRRREPRVENLIGDAGGAESLGAEALQRNSLQAGQKNLDALQILLQKKQARQARLAKKAERKARREERKKQAEGEKLKARKAIDFVTYDNAQKFHNLDAKAAVKKENNFALQLASSNKHQEQAAIKENSGSKFNSGTKLQAEAEVDAGAFAEKESLFEDAFLDNKALEAEGADSDQLNAQEARRQQNAATIDAQTLDQRGVGFDNNIFRNSNTGFFGNSNFGEINPLFKK